MVTSNASDGNVSAQSDSNSALGEKQGASTASYVAPKGDSSNSNTGSCKRGVWGLPITVLLIAGLIAGLVLGLRSRSEATPLSDASVVTTLRIQTNLAEAELVASDPAKTALLSGFKTSIDVPDGSTVSITRIGDTLLDEPFVSLHRRQLRQTRKLESSIAVYFRTTLLGTISAETTSSNFAAVLSTVFDSNIKAAFAAVGLSESVSVESVDSVVSSSTPTAAPTHIPTQVPTQSPTETSVEVPTDTPTEAPTTPLLTSRRRRRRDTSAPTHSPTSTPAASSDAPN